MSAPASGPARFALWAAFAACAAAVFWLANAVAPWAADRNNMWHHYEYLTEGFLAGHTYLPVEPAPELLRLSDPYDPAANAKYRLWDASLYRGRYYLYFGPGPAVALMLPWRIATGRPAWPASSGGFAGGTSRGFRPSPRGESSWWRSTPRGCRSSCAVRASGSCRSFRPPHACGGPCTSCGGSSTPGAARSGPLRWAWRWPSS